MRAQGKPGARCTRGLACKGVEKRTRAYRFSGGNPAFPAQWFYGLLRALPGDRLSCHRRWRIEGLTDPVGLAGHHQLDAGVEASGPHDFTVRDRLRWSFRRAWYPSAEILALAGSASVVRAPSRRSRAKPALRPHARPTLPRPPHPTPRP